MDGSVQGQPAATPRRPWRRRRWQVLAIVVAALLLAGSGLAVAGHQVGLDRLPDVHLLTSSTPASDTLVYDRTGTVLLADLHPGGFQRYQVPLAAMGRWLPAATDAEAGSALTQRLVRLRLGVGGSTAVARLRQAALTLEANAAYSHAQVLELYLNSAFYGSGAYGGQAAARVYFGLDAPQLDLAQAALLAGLPQRPTVLDPRRNWSGAKQRQREVLDAMVRSHAITARQAEAAKAESLRLSSSPDLMRAPGFVSQVIVELTGRLGRDAMQRGLRVVTTLDWSLQQRAEEALKDAVQANGWRGVTSGALVAIDPRSGEVLAMVGSVDPSAVGGQFNMAVWPRNPGPAFQVFTYTAAIASKRYTMVTPVADRPLAVNSLAGPPYLPQNADRMFHGACELRACLGNSLSVPAVEVELATGLPEVVGTARAMGAPPLLPHFGASGTIRYSSDDGADSFGPSLTVGGYGQTPLQMATAMSVLASGGVRRPPAILRSVSGPSGATVFRAADGHGLQAVDPGTAFVVSQMLADDTNRWQVLGAGTPLVLPGRHAAALTGTPDDRTDAWALGYTPSLAAAVWMGNLDFRPMPLGSDALAVAAPAWHRFMQAALDQMQKGDEWYSAPPGVQSSTVGGREAWFLPGTSAATPAPALPLSVHLASS